MNKNLILIVCCMLLVNGCCGRSEKDTCGLVQFSSPQAGVVNAMTFNIRVDTLLDGFNRWNNRKQVVFDTLASNAADVVGIQEALDYQVEDVQQAMPQYSHYMAGRSDGKQKGESCAVFYRKDRFAMDDCGTFWFSDSPDKPGSKYFGSLWPRICSWVHLVEKQTGAAFYVYNVHLDPISQSAREKSVEVLAQQIAARKTSDPFIVMGDFNMELDNPAMVRLQNIGYQTPYPRMVDAWQALHPGQSAPGTHHSFNGRASGAKIDHIPICENAIALEAKIDHHNIDGRYPSDHFPVVAKIALTAAGKKPIAAETKLKKPLHN